MPFAEVIYEPGSKSVVNYETEDELKAALAEHHRRAMAGESGAAQDQTERNIIADNIVVAPGSLDLKQGDFANLPHIDKMKERPAERITKVYTYPIHPADFNSDGVVHVDELSKLVTGMTKDGVVDVEQLRAALRDELLPTYPSDQGRHESMYKMEGTELDLAFLNSGTNV
jgi:hypothetical protein